MITTLRMAKAATTPTMPEERLTTKIGYEDDQEHNGDENNRAQPDEEDEANQTP
jgi:hypothetical protein